MKKTTTKILMAALSLIMALGIATGTTFAWFSLNNKVTVTGMTVTTQVGDNLLISATTDDDPKDNSDYRPSMVVTLNQLLEPVSSISGMDSTFFYTASTNVDGVSGDAVLEQYIAYDHGSTAAFDTNYGTTGAKGYADYKFTLKAMNSGTAPIYLDITSLTLHYGDTATAVRYLIIRTRYLYFYEKKKVSMEMMFVSIVIKMGFIMLELVRKENLVKFYHHHYQHHF